MIVQSLIIGLIAPALIGGVIALATDHHKRRKEERDQ